MKKLLTMTAALAALIALPAHAGSHINIGFYSPAPVYYQPAPVYYTPRTVTYYQPYSWQSPRYYDYGHGRHYGRDRHSHKSHHGRHHGHNGHGGRH